MKSALEILDAMERRDFSKDHPVTALCTMTAERDRCIAALRRVYAASKVLGGDLSLGAKYEPKEDEPFSSKHFRLLLIDMEEILRGDA